MRPALAAASEEPDRAVQTPLALYRARLAAGSLEPDPGQELAVEKLTLLHRRLAHWRAAPKRPLLARLGWARAAAAEPPTGLYLYGGVGRGKTMLMDLFYASAPVAARRRAHFHAFMLDVHARIHEWRRAGRAASARIGADPIPPVAAAIAAESTLLCFDEFQVRDPADALILDRLFEALFEQGVVVVATSNTAPRDLYAGGLNRDRFLPFVARLERHLDALALEGPVDYRRRLMARMPVFFSPLGATAEAALSKAFATLTHPAEGRAEEIAVGGRRLGVPRCAKGVAWFSFAALCEAPLGAADYLAIARRFHTVVLAGIPRLAPADRNAAMRLVTLIDILYDHRVKLICSAAAAPEALYPHGDGAREFHRAVSRLHEMQSRAYLEAEHAP